MLFKRKFLLAYAKKLGRGTTVAQAYADIINVIETVAAALAPQYRFGPHDTPDIKQEAVIIALKVLKEGKYDVSRPLDRFLYRHLKNRLGNFKRDNYERREPPCKCICPRYEKWLERNTARKNVLCPISIDLLSDENIAYVPDTIHGEAVASELLTFLQNRMGDLDPKIQRDFDAMVNGGRVFSPARVRTAVAVLLEDYDPSLIPEEYRKDG